MRRWVLSLALAVPVVRHKFLDVPLTREQLAEFIQIPPRQ